MHKPMSTAIFKNNKLHCSNCLTLLKEEHEFTDEEKAANRGEINMGRRYCGACAPTRVDNPDDIQPRPKKENNREDKEDPNELTFFN